MEECNFQPSSDSTSSDATTINQACDDASVELRYITSFYTIFLLINGEETRPKTDEERVFAIFANSSSDCFWVASSNRSLLIFPGAVTW